MSLGQVRTYLNTRIKEVLPTWNEWSDGFNSENIPASQFGRVFQINYGELSSEALNDSVIRDNWPVAVELFFKGSRHPKEAVDDALNRAHEIRKKVIHPKGAMSGINIKNVICSGINATPVHSSNDNAIKVTIDFRFNLMFNVN
jgi:hypothetical protein